MFWLRLALALIAFVVVRYLGNEFTDSKHPKTWLAIASLVGILVFFSDLAVRLAD